MGLEVVARGSWDGGLMGKRAIADGVFIGQEWTPKNVKSTSPNVKVKNVYRKEGTALVVDATTGLVALASIRALKDRYYPTTILVRFDDSPM